jgi:hypothetical protein
VAATRVENPMHILLAGDERFTAPGWTPPTRAPSGHSGPSTVATCSDAFYRRTGVKTRRRLATGMWQVTGL